MTRERRWWDLGDGVFVDVNLARGMTARQYMRFRFYVAMAHLEDAIAAGEFDDGSPLPADKHAALDWHTAATDAAFRAALAAHSPEGGSDD